MADVMTQERSSGTVPHYCPHPGCRWSFVGPKKQADGYLAVHMRVIHKGDDPRPATAAAADPDAALLTHKRRQAKAAKAARTTNGSSATSGEGNGSVPADPSPSPDPATTGDGGSCKTPGCPNDANTRYDRGVYYRLCEEVCIPRRRDEISRAASERRQADATPRQVAAADPTPEPEHDRMDAVRAKLDEHLRDQEIARTPGFAEALRLLSRARRDLLAEEQRYIELLRRFSQTTDYQALAPIFADAADRL